MCFIDILEDDMATKIIIKFVIVIKKNATSASEKKKFINIRKKKEQKRTKIFKKKNMNSDLAYLGSGKTKTELKFLQEITKSSSNPLLHTSTFEFITYFLLTPKIKIGFFTSIGVLLPNFIFSTTTTIKLTC